MLITVEYGALAGPRAAAGVFVAGLTWLPLKRDRHCRAAACRDLHWVASHCCHAKR
jgi:hypothetical protein